MKKFLALLLCLAMMLACTAALAAGPAKTTLGTIDVGGAFELQCTVPEGYSIQEMDSPTESGVLARWIGSEDQTRPIMSLFIAYDELLAQVDRLNDLDDAALAQIEATFTEDNAVEISYMETTHGTKLMFVRSAQEEIDFIDFFTIYKGYEIEFMMMNGLEAAPALSEEQIQMAVNFLSDLDFVETSTTTSDFVGTWFDETSKRAVMDITTENNGLYFVEISWADSASEVDVWRMTAYLADDDTLTYTDGTHNFETYAEDGSISALELRFDESEGTFTLKDGAITWTDSKEESAVEFVFKKAE